MTADDPNDYHDLTDAPEQTWEERDQAEAYREYKESLDAIQSLKQAATKARR